MELVYACLIGEWVCLNNDDTCTINEVDADIWFKDNADIFNPKVVQVEHTYY